MPEAVALPLLAAPASSGQQKKSKGTSAHLLPSASCLSHAQSLRLSHEGQDPFLATMQGSVKRLRHWWLLASQSSRAWRLSKPVAGMQMQLPAFCLDSRAVVSTVRVHIYSLMK